MVIHFLIASTKPLPFSFLLPHVVSAMLIVTGQSCKFWETRFCMEVVCLFEFKELNYYDRQLFSFPHRRELSIETI